MKAGNGSFEKEKETGATIFQLCEYLSDNSHNKLVSLKKS
jgi:hypothetical protein